ncbi:hypothetical protein WJX74_008804 [Apatococcus lobatus]|uniref:Aminotransferase class I/classII large domain-containing protein n=1 Tax=Apatococcus lobatus TaxID=904363 RepID=A0AAW1S0F1_9CHLO
MVSEELGFATDVPVSQELLTEGKREEISPSSCATLGPFRIERYFAKHEFSVQHLLCCSDCEPLHIKELLELADTDSLKRWERMSLGYTESSGLPALREEVANMYNSNVAASEVLVLAPEEGIFLSMQALLQPDDEVIVMVPGYQSLSEVAKAMGCSIKPWGPVLQSDNSLAFNLDTLAALIGPETKAVIVNFPHNPTGALLTASEWKELIRLCRDNQAFLFSDEMYRLLEHDPSTRLPSACEEMPEASITLSGVSKTIGLPGLRIGWLVCKNPEVMSRLRELRDYTTICNSAPSEILALMALRAQDKLLQRSMSIISSNLMLLQDFFAQHKAAATWHAPKAGPIAFPSFHLGKPSSVTCQELIDQHSLLLLPAEVWEHQPSQQQQRLRIGFGRSSMQAALDKLGQYLAQEEL